MIVTDIRRIDNVLEDLKKSSFEARRLQGKNIPLNREKLLRFLPQLTERIRDIVRWSPWLEAEFSRDLERHAVSFRRLYAKLSLSVRTKDESAVLEEILLTISQTLPLLERTSLEVRRQPFLNGKPQKPSVLAKRPI